MKKLILKLDLHDGKDKRKALKTVSALTGIDAISMDMKGKTLTLIGTVDPVSVVSRLRKFWPTELLLVGPAKEPEKKEEPKKEEAKKEEPKKEEPPKEEPKKEEPKKEEPPKEEPKKEEPPKKEEEKKPGAAPAPAPAAEAVAVPMPSPAVGSIVPYNYRPYYPPMNTHYYVHHSMEENPNACVIF